MKKNNILFGVVALAMVLSSMQVNGVAGGGKHSKVRKPSKTIDDLITSNQKKNLLDVASSVNPKKDTSDLLELQKILAEADIDIMAYENSQAEDARFNQILKDNPELNDKVEEKMKEIESDPDLAAQTEELAKANGWTWKRALKWVAVGGVVTGALAAGLSYTDYGNNLLGGTAGDAVYNAVDKVSRGATGAYDYVAKTAESLHGRVGKWWNPATESTT